MALKEHINVRLEAGDQVTLVPTKAQQPDAGYEIHVTRDGKTKPLLNDGLTTPALLTPGGTIIIDGQAQGSVIDVPDHKAVSFDLEIKTDSPLRVTGGSFVLTAESTQNAIVTTKENNLNNARVSQGDINKNPHLADSDRVLHFVEEAAGNGRADYRTIGVEEGAPSIQVSNEQNLARGFNFSGRKSLAEIAQAPGISLVIKENDQPYKAEPPQERKNQAAQRKDYLVRLADTLPSSSQNNHFKAEAERINGLQGIASRINNSAEKAIAVKAYANVVESMEDIIMTTRNGSLNKEAYANFHATLNQETLKLSAIKNPSTETLVLISNFNATMETMQVAAYDAGMALTDSPKPPPPMQSPPFKQTPPGQPPARDADQIEDIATQISDAAQSAFKAAGPRMREWKGNAATLRDLANQTKENPTEENLEALNTQLDKTIQFLDSKQKEFPNSEPGKRRTREAPRRHDLLEGLQQELQKAAPELNQTNQTVDPASRQQNSNSINRDNTTLPSINHNNAKDIRSVAGNIIDAAKDAQRSAGQRMIPWQKHMQELSQAAQAINNGVEPSPEEVQALTTKLAEVTTFLDQKQKEFPNKAPRHYETLNALQTQLQNAIEGPDKSSSTELPKDVMLAAKQALNPAVPQQNAMASNYDSKSPHSNIPGGAGPTLQV